MKTSQKGKKYIYLLLLLLIMAPPSSAPALAPGSEFPNGNGGFNVNDTTSILYLLITRAEQLYEQGKLHEAFIKAIDILHYIMEHPDESANIQSDLPFLINILKDYRKEYQDQTISDRLLSLLHICAQTKIYGALARRLKEEFREDILPRKVTYQKFSSAYVLTIKGLEKFPFYFKDKMKYKNHTISIEWLEEQSGFWVPDKIIFLDDQEKPLEVLYPRRIYDSSSALTGLTLKIYQEDLIPGGFISGLRVRSNQVVVNKSFNCKGYNGARARAYVGENGVVTRIHLSPVRDKKAKDINLAIIKCSGIPLAAYIHVPRSVLYELSHKYGELEITNLFMNTGPRVRSPKIGNFKAFQLAGYAGAAVRLIYKPTGTAFFRIQGLNGLPPVIRKTELTEKAKTQRVRWKKPAEEQLGRMAEVSIQELEDKDKLIISKKVFAAIRKAARLKSGVEGYYTGVIFSTNKGIGIFFEEGEMLTAETFKRRLEVWCYDKKQKINPASLRVISVFHIHTAPYYLKRASLTDPLSYIILPTAEVLRKWKIYTLYLTWSLRELGAAKHLDYDSKHLVAGQVHNDFFYAGYLNHTSLTRQATAKKERLNPTQLRNSGALRFLPVGIIDNEQRDPRKGKLPDFMVKWIGLKEEPAPLLPAIKRMPPEEKAWRHELFLENRGLIHAVIRRYFWPRFSYLLSYEELLKVGERVLYTTVLDFDYTLKSKLSSLAWLRLRGQIEKHIRSLLKYLPHEISQENISRRRDGESVSNDRLAFMADKAPNPEEVLLQREENERIRALCRHIKRQKVRDAFEIYVGLTDGEPHSLKETARLLYQKYITESVTPPGAVINSVTRKNRTFDRGTISGYIREAQLDILSGLYGRTKARLIIADQEDKKREERELSAKIRKQWHDFTTGGLQTENWHPFFFTPRLYSIQRKPKLMLQVPGGPFFDFDIEYQNREICMDLKEIDQDKRWVVFRFICDGETIKEVILELSASQIKRKATLPEYMTVNDYFRLRRLRKWLARGQPEAEIPRDRIPFLVLRHKRLVGQDTGIIRLVTTGKRKMQPEVPATYVDQVVQIFLAPGGSKWFMLKIYDSNDDFINAYIYRWLPEGKISRFKVTWEQLNFYNKVTAAEKNKKSLTRLLRGEVTAGRRIRRKAILVLRNELERMAAEMLRQRKSRVPHYDSGYHWQLLRKIEIIDLYLEMKQDQLLNRQLRRQAQESV